MKQEILTKFIEQGYIVQEPTKDKTLSLTDNIHQLLLDYILDLGYTEYQVTSAK